MKYVLAVVLAVVVLGGTAVASVSATPGEGPATILPNSHSPKAASANFQAATCTPFTISYTPSVTPRMVPSANPGVPTPAPTVQHIVAVAYFPAQFDPSGDFTGHWKLDWERVLQLGQGSLVVFDRSGSQEADIRKLIGRVHTQQMKILGYVHTGNGLRNECDVMADIDAWYRLNDGSATNTVDGIFLDEGPIDPVDIHLPYYQRLYSYIKAKTAVSGNTILLNVAGTLDERIMDLADIVNIWEAPSSNVGGYAPESYYMMLPWIPKYSADRFSQVLYYRPSGATSPTPGPTMSPDEVSTVVALSKDRGAGYIYVLDTDTKLQCTPIPSGPAKECGYNHAPSADNWSAASTAVALGRATTQRPPASKLVDPFAGSAVKKELWRASVTGGAAVSEGGGSLNLTLANGTGGSTPSGNSQAGVRSGATYDLTGSYVQVHAVEVASLQNPKVNTSFALVYEDRLSGNNESQLRWIFYSEQVGTQLKPRLVAQYITKPAGVETTIEVARLDYSPLDHAWWRLRETGGLVHWETRADSPTAAWLIQGTPVPVTALFPLQALKVDLRAIQFNSWPTPPGQARYRGLNVLEETPTVTATHTGTATATLTVVIPIATSTLTAETSTVGPTATSTPTSPVIMTVTIEPTKEGVPTLTVTPTATDVVSPTVTPTTGPSVTSTPSDGTLPGTGGEQRDLWSLLPFTFIAVLVLIFGLRLYSTSRDAEGDEWRL